jgi:divalent metal cation (Fe/Co/Zn/Cd) transporter
MRVLPITDEQYAREQSILVAIAMDVTIMAAMVVVSVAGGSFTLFAESIRVVLGLVPEFFTYAVIRRIHRGVLVNLDYGTGKLEQLANLVIGISMLIAAVWIVVGAGEILSGDRKVGAPIGLACAAIAGMVNLCINIIAWDGMRRVTASDDSTILQAQLTLRWTKLVASLIIGLDLTLAALSADDVIVTWADAIGSLVVAAYMTVTAVQALRRALPDLLDLSAGAVVRQAVDRALARYGDGMQVLRVRTRRSGHTVFVELALAYDEGFSRADVDRQVVALKESIGETVEGAEVSVLATAQPQAGVAADLPVPAASA